MWTRSSILGKKVSYSVFSALSLSVIAIFGTWWFNPRHLPHNFHGGYRAFDVLLFLILTYVIWHPIVMEVMAWAIGSHIKEDAPKYEPLPGLRVAFVTTFVPQAESIELLYKSLPAMMNADYPHDTWVLDEGNDPRVKKLCQDIGVKHFSRAGQAYLNTERGKFARKTKGGNSNSWYECFGDDYDIVAQLDTDFVPSQEFLVKTLGYFRDPAVAFVGTPQIYGNHEESFIARGAAQQTYKFYGSIMRGLHAMDTTLLIGANHVIRVAALRSVDLYSAHITEDLLTGMKLHSTNWKSIYVAEPLAIGEGPSTWQAYFNQQMRWAFGCIDVLFKHSPRLLPRMSFRRKIYYLWLQQHYFSGLAMGLSLVGLGLYFLFGINTGQINPWTFLGLYGLVVAACSVMTWQLQKYNVRPNEEGGIMLAGRVLSIASWPIYFLALVGVICGKRLTFKVTPKGFNSFDDPKRTPLRVFGSHLFIALYCLACMAYSVVGHHRSIIMLALAASSALIMFSMPFVLTSYHAVDSSNRFLTLSMEWLVKRFRLLEPNRTYRYLKRRHPYMIGLSLLSFVTATIGESFSVSGNHFSWAVWLLYGYVPFFLTGVYYLFVSARKDLSFLAEWSYPGWGSVQPYNQAGFVHNIYSTPGAPEPVDPVKSVVPAEEYMSPFEKLLAQAEANMAARAPSL